MAFTGVMCTEADIDAKTGAGVSILWTDTMKTREVLMAESYVNAMSRKNWSTVWATLDDETRTILTETVSSLVAIQGILYTTTGYNTVIEAEDKINVLWARVVLCIARLKEQSVVTFITKNGA